MSIVKLTAIFLFFQIIAFGQNNVDGIFRTESGNVVFKSDAPLEIISAKSNELRGVFDIQNRSFVFQLRVVSLKGFNSTLQQEHFYENYLESDKFPYISFKGKLVEHIDFKEDGEYSVRAKGNFSIHGIEKEEIIKARIRIGREELVIESDFQISIEDYNIKIPHVVYQKIAEEIDISLDVAFIKE